MSELQAQLLRDLNRAHHDLATLKQQQKQLEWQIDYLQKLLASPAAQASAAGTREQADSAIIEHGQFTIAEAARIVLKNVGRPMSGMEIARHAQAMGVYDPNLNIERARSHFSAVISKDIDSRNPRFWQVGRGLIGLIEWKNDPRFEQIAKSMILAEETKRTIT